ncbi:HNH endonuclease [Haloarchaeobius amylolyticus]|uniref:HNH endonuclease n=1 Tax=Haloarchaeobius amylolyticus TaxID=1198296 RepID=UPI00226D7179|nr:HNH endonuclease [Haloarchaeobius amylolyticus]
MADEENEAEWPCPSCDSRFETQRGLHVHHWRSHDERLPNRECRFCGTEFYSEHEQRYCSTGCRQEATSSKGSENPNYRGGKAETTCRICGSSFEYYPSEKTGVYCSVCVEDGEWQETPCLDGTDNPRWKGGKREVACTYCGEPVSRYPSEINETVLCSETCRSEWLSESNTGSGHPNWKGGDPGPYGTGWSTIRRQALERDGYRCVICGTTKEELGRNPDVHHLVPVRLYAESTGFDVAEAHELENVASLCTSCHRKADFGKISWTELRNAVSEEL